MRFWREKNIRENLLPKYLHSTVYTFDWMLLFKHKIFMNTHTLALTGCSIAWLLNQWWNILQKTFFLVADFNFCSKLLLEHISCSVFLVADCIRLYLLKLKSTQLHHSLYISFKKISFLLLFLYLFKMDECTKKNSKIQFRLKAWKCFVATTMAHMFLLSINKLSQIVCTLFTVQRSSTSIANIARKLHQRREYTNYLWTKMYLEKYY